MRLSLSLPWPLEMMQSKAILWTGWCRSAIRLVGLSVCGHTDIQLTSCSSNLRPETVTIDRERQTAGEAPTSIVSHSRSGGRSINWSWEGRRMWMRKKVVSWCIVSQDEMRSEKCSGGRSIVAQPTKTCATKCLSACTALYLHAVRSLVRARVIFSLIHEQCRQVYPCAHNTNQIKLKKSQNLQGLRVTCRAAEPRFEAPELPATRYTT